MTDYEAVIGLEVHAQLHTRSKLFCGCSTAYGAAPNTQVCAVCLGLPGALPVPNAEAIRMAVRAGIALSSEVMPRSRLARKNYFYPDLAKGYQISQYEAPINLGGRLEVRAGGAARTIGITRIHIEEDAAKNIHGGSHGTLVDFNRAGVPLVEIVSEPELRSADEAEAYLRALREILMFIGVNDGNLEEGSFRCDANVSIRPRDEAKFGTRVELKNINSFRFVKKAIDYEIARQANVLRAGGAIVQETRAWLEDKNETMPMRGKEEAHDYRYFPDPDLPELVLSEGEIAALRSALPELPRAKRERWKHELGLTEYDAQVLTGHPEIARFMEETTVVLGATEAKRVANFIQAEVLRVVRTDGLSAMIPVTSGQLAELLSLVKAGTISGTMAKDVLNRTIETGRSPGEIVAAEGLAQVSDVGAIEAEVRNVLAANPKQVESYRNGNEKVLGFLVGQVMRASKGRANPGVVNDMLRKLLSKES